MFRYTCLCLTGCPCLRGRRPHPRSTSLRFVNYVVSPAPRFVSSLLLVAPRFSRGKVIWSRDVSPRMASLWTAVDVGRPKSQQLSSSNIKERACLSSKYSVIAATTARQQPRESHQGGCALYRHFLLNIQGLAERRRSISTIGSRLRSLRDGLDPFHDRGAPELEHLLGVAASEQFHQRGHEFLPREHSMMTGKSLTS